MDLRALAVFRARRAMLKTVTHLVAGACNQGLRHSLVLYEMIDLYPATTQAFHGIKRYLSSLGLLKAF
jgi:hypothetical protein